MLNAQHGGLHVLPHVDPAGLVSLKVGDWEWRKKGEAPVTIVVGDNAKFNRDLKELYFHV